MRHFSDAYAALRRKNRGQYALLADAALLVRDISIHAHGEIQNGLSHKHPSFSPIVPNGRKKNKAERNITDGCPVSVL